MADKEYHLVTDETAQQILGAINDLVEAQGGTPSQVGTATEYGARKVKGASSPTWERVTRVNGVITPWDISYTPNVGDNITENPFERISLFSPPLFVDKAGNAFRRRKRFYYGTETIGNYEYVWVCEKQLYGWYKLPNVFKRDGVPYWNYVDEPVYEGSFETVDGVKYLCSKTGKIPAHSITRTTAYNAAKAWHTRLDIDTDKEEYLITTMSEITEILQPLLLIMFGSTNSQAFYNGVCNFGAYAWSNATVEAYDLTTNTLYFTNSNVLTYFRVGAVVSFNGSSSDENYRKVIANGTVTGTIEDKVFTESEDGTTYYFIQVDGGDITVTPNYLNSRPLLTGETDAIDAMCGTLSNDGYHSFKVMGRENVYGNVWKHILDCTILDYVPYVCKDLTQWTDTSDPANNPAFEKCSYTVATTSGSYTKELGHDESHSDIKLPTVVGASSSTYYCDYYWINSGAMTVLFGGTLYSGANDGAFYWDLSDGVGNANWRIGASVLHKSL